MESRADQVSAFAFALLLTFFRASYLDFWGTVLCVVMMSISSLFYIIMAQWLIGKTLKLVPLSGFVPGLDLFKFLALPLIGEGEAEVDGVTMPGAQALARARTYLDRGMSVEDGFAAICQACLAQFQANLPGVLASGDIEYVHQARVALRRLRAALRLFRRVCVLPDAQLDGLRALAAAPGA